MTEPNNAAPSAQSSTAAQPQSDAQAQAAGQGQAPPQGMTPEDFNRAFSARERRLQESFEQRLAAREAEWAKRFEALQPKAQEPGQPDPAAAAEARIRAMEKRLAEEQELRTKTETERARTEERSALMNGLAAIGVTGPRASAAAALLHGELGTVRRAKDGRIVFVVPRDGYTDELDLAKGLAEWAKSPEGKEFLPARDAGGSGEPPRRPGAPPTNGKPRPGERLLAALTGIEIPIR